MNKTVERGLSDKTIFLNQSLQTFPMSLVSTRKVPGVSPNWYVTLKTSILCTEYEYRSTLVRSSMFVFPPQVVRNP